MRAEVAAARRVVVKVGSSSLTNASGDLSGERVDALVDAIGARRASGVELVLVSSGAIAAGVGPPRLRSRPPGPPTQQAAASVRPRLLPQRHPPALSRHPPRVGQVRFTAAEVGRRTPHPN